MNKPESITEAQRWYKDGYAAAIEDSIKIVQKWIDHDCVGPNPAVQIKALLQKGTK